VRGELVVGVPGRLELEGAVLDLEVLVQALGQGIEDAWRTSVREHVVGDNDPVITPTNGKPA